MGPGSAEAEGAGVFVEGLTASTETTNTWSHVEGCAQPMDLTALGETMEKTMDLTALGKKHGRNNAGESHGCKKRSGYKRFN